MLGTVEASVVAVQRELKGDAVCFWAAAMKEVGEDGAGTDVTVGVVTSVLRAPDETRIVVVGDGGVRAVIPVCRETSLMGLGVPGKEGAGLCEVRVGGRVITYEGKRSDVDTLAVAFNKASRTAEAPKTETATTTAAAEAIEQTTMPRDEIHMDEKETNSADKEGENGSNAETGKWKGKLAATDVEWVERTLRSEEAEHCTHKTVS